MAFRLTQNKMLEKYTSIWEDMQRYEDDGQHWPSHSRDDATCLERQQTGTKMSSRYKELSLIGEKQVENKQVALVENPH